MDISVWSRKTEKTCLAYCSRRSSLKSRTYTLDLQVGCTYNLPNVQTVFRILDRSLFGD